MFPLQNTAQEKTSCKFGATKTQIWLSEETPSEKESSDSSS